MPVAGRPTFAMDDASRLERDYRVHDPPPALSGPRLANRVFRDGVVGRTLETGYLFDHLFTPRVTDRVLSDIDRVRARVKMKTYSASGMRFSPTSRA